MGSFDEHKPAMAMVGLQFCYACISLFTRIVLVQGMSPRVYVVYRQAIATLVMTPIGYFSRRNSNIKCSLNLRSFSLIFLSALIGVTLNQNLYFEGLYLASTSVSTAMSNLVPAVTFVLASILGLEKLNFGSMRTIAKILGTILCVSGAVFMALLKGPKLLNAELQPEHWLLGCLFVFASCCCWALWLILQVLVSESYSDHLSLSAWMCFSATIQSAILTLFIERDPNAWNIHSPLEVACILFTGCIGSGLSFFVQAWIISRRGPLFSAMFNPLCTVIVTILAAAFLHEKIYTGSLIGGVGVIIGLYAVLWGKAKDLVEIKENANFQTDEASTVKTSDVDTSEKTSWKIDLEKPLLTDKACNVDESGICK
ncbi:WAT1-related protein At4g30420 [Quercus suber]|uniref:WAT1-related protein n=1 Tax=Quercus suber TaxID=58331 RepID=A0AAW0K5G4_QUESU|nr:WAT1-related protein At4g30420 [Quercus suber]